MRRDQLPPNRSATYVLPRWKVVYVAVNKAACTSLKWLVADLQEEDGQRFHTSLSREVSRTMTIHRRRLWQHTPMLHGLADDELADIAPERGWLVFAVTRHPSERLWSAWQSKLLLREPSWTEKYREAPWFPRIPSTTEDVVEDFRRFVRSIGEDPEQRIMRNRHFAPQTLLLTPDRTPYTRIYDTREMPQFLDDLATHLRGQGWEGSVHLARGNETPLRPLKSMFPHEVSDVVGKVYRDDFERFGYAKVEPDALETAGEYSDVAIREIGRLVERSERIGDLALTARRLKGVARTNQRELRAVKSEAAKGPLARIPSVRAAAGGLARKARRQRRRAVRLLTSDGVGGGFARALRRRTSRRTKRAASPPHSAASS